MDADKKKELFEAQKKTLDTFLETGAITRAQYEYSLNGLITKMGMKEGEKPVKN